mgnify:CR=1 FL=1
MKLGHFVTTSAVLSCWLSLLAVSPAAAGRAGHHSGRQGIDRGEGRDAPANHGRVGACRADQGRQRRPYSRRTDDARAARASRRIGPRNPDAVAEAAIWPHRAPGSRPRCRGSIASSSCRRSRRHVSRRSRRVPRRHRSSSRRRRSSRRPFSKTSRTISRPVRIRRLRAVRCSPRFRNLKL